MSDYLTQVLKSGRTILTDTKLPATKEKRETVAKASANPLPVDADPHKVFVKKTIADKPKKLDVVEDFKRFIKVEEAKL
jgi:hypothetical protein